MAIVEESKGEKPNIPDGLHTFRITKVRQDVRKGNEYGNEGEPTLVLTCVFPDLEDDDGNMIALDPILALKFSRGGKYQPSNLYLYAQAAGVCPPEGEPFDTDLLEGRVLMGKVVNEKDKWPKIVPESLMPVKAVKGQPVAVDTPPWDEADDGSAVAAIVEDAKKIGFSMKEIIDVAQSEVGKPIAELSAVERERFRKALGV